MASRSRSDNLCLGLLDHIIWSYDYCYYCYYYYVTVLFIVINVVKYEWVIGFVSFTRKFVSKSPRLTRCLIYIVYIGFEQIVYLIYSMKWKTDIKIPVQFFTRWAAFALLMIWFFMLSSLWNFIFHFLSFFVRNIRILTEDCVESGTYFHGFFVPSCYYFFIASWLTLIVRFFLARNSNRTKIIDALIIFFRCFYTCVYVCLYLSWVYTYCRIFYT